jgi:hypothetical protein
MRKTRMTRSANVFRFTSSTKLIANLETASSAADIVSVEDGCTTIVFKIASILTRNVKSELIRTLILDVLHTMQSKKVQDSIGAENSTCIYFYIKKTPRVIKN